MGSWTRTALLLGLLWPGLFAHAAGSSDLDAVSTELGEQLLALAGTASVFDSPRLQAALHDPQPLLAPEGKTLDPGRVLGLLKAAGFQVWKHRPRLWIVQQGSDGALTLLDTDARLQAEAGYRSLPLSSSPVAAADAASLADPNIADAALLSLLGAHQAEALVLVSAGNAGYAWQIRRPGWQRSGVLPASADLSLLLPHVLSEVLSVPVEWPEAGGRNLIHVSGVGGFVDLSALQKALQALDGVQGLSLVRVDGADVWFAADAPGGSILMGELAATGHLNADNTRQHQLKPLLAQGLSAAGMVSSWSWTGAADKPAAAPVTPANNR